MGVDEDGDIYIIETKLYRNPDKRQIVAQLLEYGAGLWMKYSASPDKFLDDLNKEMEKREGLSLVQKLSEFGEERVDSIISEIKQNMADGRYIFVVLMDTIPEDLKSILQYLNQNSRFDIFAVELEFYEYEDLDIVVPRIYGVEISKSTKRDRGIWSEDSFLDDAGKRLSEEHLEILRNFYEFSKENFQLEWGTGSDRGSFNAKHPSLGKKSIYSVFSDGKLHLNFGWLPESEIGNKVAELLKNELEKASFEFREDWRRKFPGFKISEWGPKVDKLMSALAAVKQILDE